MDIDLSQLEIEWQGQAPMYEKAAKGLAEARRAAAELDIELTVVKAEAGKEVRTNPDEFGMEKVTEAAIKEAVDTHKKVIRLRKKMAEARYLVDLLEGTCRALEHRKRALEKEVELFLAGYFAAPKEKRRSLSPVGRNEKADMPAGLRGRRKQDDEDDDD